MITYDPARKIYTEENTGILDVRRSIPLKYPIQGEDVITALKEIKKITKDKIFFIPGYPFDRIAVDQYSEKIFLDRDGEITAKIGMAGTDLRSVSPLMQSVARTDLRFDPRLSVGLGILLRTGSDLNNIGISSEAGYDNIGIGTTYWGSASPTFEQCDHHQSLVEIVNFIANSMKDALDIIRAQKSHEIIPLGEDGA